MSNRGCVSWRGLTAVYTRFEREIMAALPVKEQAFVHLLKATTDGEIQDPGTAERLVRSRSPSTEGEPAPCTGDPVDGRDIHAPGPGLDCFAIGGSIPPAGIDRKAIYTDPEDLEFGPPKRRKKLYAVAWTWRKHRIVKTKKRGNEVLKVWKRWYERQGWTVRSHPTGYFATKNGERHAASLHEYDFETKERLV